MLKHLFKLIWNKKKQNFVLMLEILVSFLVIFAVFTMVVYYYKNYRKPLNLQYERVWAIHFEIPSRPPNRDSLLLFYENLRNQIKSMPEIEAVSITSSNVPFSMSTMQNNFNYDGKGITLNDYICEGEHARVLGAKMAAGRWFSKEDNASKYRPVVINEELKKRWFGNSDAIGKILNKESDQPYRIVGVVTDMKTKGDYQLVEPELYRRADTADYYWLSNALVRVKPTADVAFESRLYKSLPNFINHGTLEIEHLTDKLVSRNSMTLVPMIILMIVAGFFVVNVALGLFGVLWYNINRRRGEIGLRRAVGATGQSVSRQLVSEALVLATMALIVGCFFAVQFPLMNVFDMPASVYLIAIGLSVIFIYGLVAACSFYPGKQAATIYPAVALHEE